MATHTEVLIVGGGFAGIACAQRLERLLGKATSITLLSTENYFVFQPLLPEVVGASLSPQHVISPLRHLLRRTTVVRSQVQQILLAPLGAPEAGTVIAKVEGFDEPLVYSADHIVLALGSVVDVSRIPGMAEQALQMKNVADALALRHTIITRLERAMVESDEARRQALLTFVVVGGGFSGVETAAEINDLAKGSMKFFPTLASVPKRVICVHARDHVLPELDRRLGDYALDVLTKRGVEFRLNARTKAASRDGVHLASGELIPTQTIVCTIGNAPHPVLKDLTANADGRLSSDEFLRLAGRDRVWVLGDCASIPDGYGSTCPPTAQFASRQGDVAARNIVAAIRNTALKPFRHKSLGQLATLGHRRGVAAIGKLRITGFLAWWLWRTIYLMKLPRFDRKLRVVIDWTLNLIFPRDLNALAVSRTSRHSAIHLEAGEALFRQGDPSTAFYCVESGRIELRRCNEAGEELDRVTLGPGDHFGEGSLLHGGKRTTTAVAMESSNVMSFRADEFVNLIKNFAGLKRLLEATSRRFQPASAILPEWVPVERRGQPVAAIMTSDVMTMAPTATLQMGLVELVQRGFNAFPLVSPAGRLLGIVTSTDLFAALRSDLDLEQPMLAIATTRVECVDRGAPVERAVEIMRRRNVNHVVVTDGQQHVVGIVSIKDVLRQVLLPATLLGAQSE